MVVKIQKNHFVFIFNNLENKHKGFTNMNSSQSFHIMLERFVMLRVFQYFAHLFQNYLELLFISSPEFIQFPFKLPADFVIVFQSRTPNFFSKS
ncbi:MAG: hypothetical protein C5S45_03960, partial [Candidatus Methanocomedens sp.]